ncbi:MAG: amidohydrolase, partial [Xanthomonadales bacterium]|nr:amidohydrolase [Xanthomonadales bacterium]
MQGTIMGVLLRFLALLAIASSAAALAASEAEKPGVAPAPARAEGEGPYPQLILRGVTVINGTGSPAFGPADIVIEGNRIVNVRSVGAPGSPIKPEDRPKLKAGGREMDLAGHYVMPGLIDLHGHIGGAEQGVPAEYVYKLWMGHGITSIRDPGCGNGIDWCVSEEHRSAK